MRLASPPAPPAPAWRALLGGIFALAAAMGIGRFAYTPILPAMQAAGELDIPQAGLLAAANYAGYLAGSALLIRAVPGWWHSRVLRASALAVVATTALMALTSGIAAWSLVRFLSGMASAGVFVLASGLVLDQLRRDGRAGLSGWLYSGVGLGIVVSGVVVLANGDALGWRGDWLLLALVAAAAFLPAWRWLPHPPADAAPRPELAPPRGHLRPALVLLAAAYFLEGLGYIVTATFLVTIIEATPGLAGIGAGVWIVAGLAVIPSAPLWGASAVRLGFARALAIAYLLQAVGIVLPLLGGTVPAFASALLFGGTFAGISALTLTFAGYLAGGRTASMVGALTAAFGLGQVVGPALAGVIAGRAQTFAPALIAASALVITSGALTALLGVADPWRHGGGPREERTPPPAGVRPEAGSTRDEAGRRR